MSEITNPVISIDFTGHAPAGGLSLGYLPEGIHSAVIMESRQYEDNKDRLYIYMTTEGIRHRDSFNIVGKGVAFLMGIFQSAGVPVAKMVGKIPKFPTKNLVTKTVYFQYTPPQLDETGRRVDGSWPQYRYYTEAEYKQLMSIIGESPAEDFSVEEPVQETTNGKAGAPIPSAPAEEDFDFLLK
jgi:hypothetical protein